MSFFSGQNADDIPDNPNELPNNTYTMQVIDAKYGPTKGGDKMGILFKHQIIEGAWQTFFPLVDWIEVPTDNTPADKVGRMLSALKMRLLAFGLTIKEIQDFGPDQVNELIGKVFYGTTFAKKDDRTGQANIRVQTFAPVTSADDGLPDNF